MQKKLMPILAIVASLLMTSSSLSAADRARVAIVGGGGSGLTTAWLLDEEHDVTLFESNSRLGGHANTVDVDINGSLIPMEAGFEFICETFFPYFYNLLNNVLKVRLHEYTNISTFYHTDTNDVLILPPMHKGKIEWSSLSAHNVFTMLEFSHVISEAKRIIEIKDVGITLEDFIEGLTLTDYFKEDFLYPFLAAGWGVSKQDIKQFAAYNAMKYVIEGQELKDYKWIEIAGGTQKYIQALASQLVNTEVKLSAKIIDIRYTNGVYTITEDNGRVSEFDHLVIATNAKIARQLLRNIPEKSDLCTILSQIRYFKTTIAIHGDARFMPPHSKDWTVVNIRFDGCNSATTVYKNWLSPHALILKSWLTFDVRDPKNQGSPMPSPLYALAEYDHPIADLKYFETQKALSAVQGNHHLWFAGNYTHDNDSHESAIVSAIKIARQLAPLSQRLMQITSIDRRESLEEPSDQKEHSSLETRSQSAI